MATLYLIRGCPGSGKSTFANDLREAGIVEEVLEADDYFLKEDGTYRFDSSKLTEAHNSCQTWTERILKQRRSVAVSNTSTTEREVATYAAIAKHYGAKFVSIIMENRHEGQNTHGVPEEKVQQMKNRFSVRL